MSDKSQAAETPLLDLLRNVPEDARAEYEHHRFSHSLIPYGRLCKHAADALGQKDVVIADLMESLDEAKYDEPEFRSKLDKQRQRIEQLEKQVYLAGHWSCPKCNFYLVSTNMHVPSGGFSANKEPQACANGCGPMWRVTHEQSANTMVDRCEDQSRRIEQLEAALGDVFALIDEKKLVRDVDRDECVAFVQRLRKAQKPLESAGGTLRCTDCGDEITDLQAHCEREDNACLIHDSETVPDQGNDNG